MKVLSGSFALLALLALLATAASAHESRPLYIQLTETNPGVFSVYWKVPTSIPQVALPSPVLPDRCSPEAEPVMQQRAEAYEFQQRFGCPGGLSGLAVGVRFPVMNPSVTSLLRVRLANGEEHVRVLKPGEDRWVVPERESRLAVAVEYVMLGVEHIWIGLDHLLFVACLVFVAGTPRRLLITVTGFTVAHSVTLGLSVLGVVRAPVPPVEAAIALSVVFLAYEIARGEASSWTFRYPVVVATSFGLLHGFGFAAVLREIGLPQTALSTALLFFNVGVEIGQLLFVVVLVAVYLGASDVARRLGLADRRKTGVVPASVVRRTPLAHRDVQPSAPALETMALPAAYIIGGLATYWMIDRIAGFWS